MKKYSLTEGSIPKGIVAFAIPMLLGNLFQQLYNTADSLIVGNFLGDNSLAAVSSVGSLIFLFIGFFQGTATGAGVIISKFYGAKDESNIKKAVHTTFAFGIVAGIILTILGMGLTPFILRWMGTPADVFPLSVKYLRMYFAGSLALVLYNICMGVLQAVGDSKHPLYYLMISSVINVILDLIFNGVFRLGVEYASLATVISQSVSVILCVRRLRKSDEVYRLELRKIRFDGYMIRQILKLGLPAGMQNSIISIANVVVQSNINSFGPEAMAGVGSYFKIEGFGFLPITCFAMSMTTYIGQNLGAKQYERAKRGANFGILTGIVLAEIMGILIFVFCEPLISCFTSTNESIAFGVLHAHTVTLFYFLLAFSHLVSGVLRGAGKSTVPMFVMLAIWCVFRIFYVTMITHFWDSLRAVSSCYPLTWAMSGVIFLLYYLKADWLHNFEHMEEQK